ncbi:MAG: histidine--tRNA ligase, partial [Clostridia bacterium]|nr:histidine--tRNA ligase [Clostridia bacterium]
NKEMYTFNDKKGRSITLKPEGTAGVVRSVIENGLTNNVMPLKMYYVTPVFRYERPQAGRLREHHQFGVEIYGAKGADMDAEVILIAYTLLKKAGLNVALNINSIGCPECRKAYNEALKNYLRGSFDQMCPVCKERFEKNPLRILDCKEEGCKAVCAGAPKILDYLCKDCLDHFENLKKYLTIAGLEYTVNPNIVRGLDYYTRTVFEFVTTDLGSQGTVCGGGRYDNLVKQLGGPDIPCVGFGMGIERILMLMEAKGVEIQDNTAPDLYIASIGEKAQEKAFEVCYKLRLLGVKCEIDHMQRGVKPQFKYADKICAKNVITIGDSEIESGLIKVKKMADGSQTECLLTAEEIAKAL